MADKPRRRPTHPDKAIESVIRGAETRQAMAGVAAANRPLLAGIESAVRASASAQVSHQLDSLLGTMKANHAFGSAIPADYITRMAEAAQAPRLIAMDLSIAKAAQNWRSQLVAAQDFGKTLGIVSASISEAVAARQTYLSDALVTLRTAGIDTALAITRSAEYLTLMRQNLAEPLKLFAQQAELTRKALDDAFRPAAFAASIDWARR